MEIAESENRSTAPEKPHLVLLRGCHGSGKTEIAIWHRIVHGFEATSIDDLVLPNGEYSVDGKRAHPGNLTSCKLKQLHTKCLNRTKKFLNEGKNVIVHNPFIKLKHIQPYLALSDIAQITVWKVILPRMPSWNAPRDVIADQKAQYEPLDYEDHVTLDKMGGRIIFHNKNRLCQQ